MTWDRIKGVANELRDSFVDGWGNMTGNDFEMTAGWPETLEEHMGAFERLWV